MKVLIINQHTSNHGDEAAAKSLYRALKTKGIEKLNILYNTISLQEQEKFILDNIEQEHYSSPVLKLIDKAILIASLSMPYSIGKKLIQLSTPLKKELDLISSADKIISAPGGVNLGPYKDWRYLWRLYIAIKEKKDLAIYSISFGPLPDNVLFKYLSKYVLKNASFLSLRDNKSQSLAKEFKIPYTESIDTAFLYDGTELVLPKEYKNILNQKYVVVVPNELYRWHPVYKASNAKLIDNKYINIFKYFLNKKYSIVCLPQLFGKDSDALYMQRLKEQIGSSNIHILNSYDSSDLQQYIISKSEFIVGARYHTIIFAINNATPFLSLAYEHKMTNTLEILELNEYSITIDEMLENDSYLEKLDKCFDKKDLNKEQIINAKQKAHGIAKKTFSIISDKFLKQ